MTTFAAKLNTHGQLTIPAKIRHRLGLKPNQQIQVLFDGKSFQIVHKDNYTLDDLPNIIGSAPKISDAKIKSEKVKAFSPSQFRI